MATPAATPRAPLRVSELPHMSLAAGAALIDRYRRPEAPVTGLGGPLKGHVTRAAAASVLALPLLTLPPLTSAASAAPPDATQLTAAASSYLTARAEVVVDEGAASTVAALPMTDAFHKQVNNDTSLVITRIRALRAVGESYTGRDTQVTLVSATGASSSARLIVDELTTLTYAQPPGGAPPFTAYDVQHTLDFASATGGGWVLAADTPSAGLLPITMVSAEPVPQTGTTPPVDSSDAISSGTVADSSETSCGVYAGCDASDAVSGATKFGPSAITAPAASALGTVTPKKAPVMSQIATDATTTPGGDVAGVPSGLNYGAMVNYAYQYWKYYNAGYRTAAGNDCTNYTSQVL